MSPRDFARRAAMRLKRSDKVRRIVFPLLRRSPVLAMAVARLLAGIKGEQFVLEQVPVPEITDESSRLTESAQRVLADLRRSSDETPAAPGAATRPRIALVSPFPPLKSGVAFHAADLALLLQRDHDVELVAPQTSIADARLANLPLRSPDWLRAHADDFDEIVYQAGNSRMHEFVFDLLNDLPGVVVMHDVFLSNVLDEMEHAGSRPLAFVRALYESHGWAAVADFARSSRAAMIWKYPASAGIMARATRVVVHSTHALDLIREWWGPALADRCTVVPLLREFPPPPSRQEARARLGIADDAFLVCSFGLLGPTKCNAQLLQAFVDSKLADDPRSSLVFVGENVPNSYGAALDRAIASHRKPARIRITGFVSAQDYGLYLAACDVAVQLRSLSRGETSAAVLDCLGHGVPTIVNAHGSSAELADDIVVKVADEFATPELATALERLRADDARRRRLAAASAAHVRDNHSAGAVVAGYREAIAQSQHSSLATYRRELRELAPQLHGATDEQLEAIAAGIAAKLPTTQRPQMLVDVSAMVRTDLGTGIQRVVRELVREWLVAPPAGYRMEPVYSPGAGMPWRYARRYAAAGVGIPQLPFDDAIAELHAGDVFVGLDLHPSLIAQNEALLLRMRERGVRVAFALYDVLPVRMPHAFPPGTDAIFEGWLRTVAKVADGVVAISKASATDFAKWIEANPPQRATPLAIGYFHLGAELPKAARARLGWRESRAMRKATASPALLMVGTIEPRKGHAQALAAAEALWARGIDVNLVIVGKAGWMMEPLVAKLKSHPRRNRQLFWFGHASDALLGALYERCAALLAPSEGEGFGLPLVEGAQRGLPLIARDLAVFREVAGDHAFYFEGATADALADAIEKWLALRSRGGHPTSEGVQRWTWRQSARSFEDAALGGNWLSRWSP